MSQIIRVAGSNYDSSILFSTFVNAIANLFDNLSSDTSSSLLRLEVMLANLMMFMGFEPQDMANLVDTSILTTVNGSKQFFDVLRSDFHVSPNLEYDTDTFSIFQNSQWETFYNSLLSDKKLSVKIVENMRKLMVPRIEHGTAPKPTKDSRWNMVENDVEKTFTAPRVGLWQKQVATAASLSTVSSDLTALTATVTSLDTDLGDLEIIFSDFAALVVGPVLRSINYYSDTGTLLGTVPVNYVYAFGSLTVNVGLINFSDLSTYFYIRVGAPDGSSFPNFMRAGANFYNGNVLTYTSAYVQLNGIVVITDGVSTGTSFEVYAAYNSSVWASGQKKIFPFTLSYVSNDPLVIKDKRELKRGKLPLRYAAYEQSIVNKPMADSVHFGSQATIATAEVRKPPSSKCS